MSWEKLKKALQEMPETGAAGFEELIGTLLGCLLNEQFIRARAGDQPSGDGQSINSAISFQAKRYKETTHLNENEIEGDIQRTIRTLPQLEVIIIALARSQSSQLQNRINTIQEEKGIDIFILDYKDEFSPISVMCFEFWDQISHFDEIRDLNEKFIEWAREKKQSLEVREKLSKLKKDITYSFQSYQNIQNLAHEFLLRRFGKDNSGANRYTYHIDINAYVVRESVEKSVLNWWQNLEKRVAYLQGEEGMGKSWIAAQFSKKISEDFGTLVFWMDSAEWYDCRSLDDVILKAIRKLGITDENKLRRLAKKVFTRWNHPILIMLDGVNERRAIEAAKAILDDFFSQGLNHIKILLTTRPLELHPGYERNIWTNCYKIFVGVFNEDEFELALQSLVPPIRFEDIPSSLSEIAKIPRYFKTCVRLKNKFGSMESITKEMVLYVDLLDRIENTDSQVRERLGWRKAEDAEEILSELARNSEISEGTTEIRAPMALLNKCFANNYDVIRVDLQELKISPKAEKLGANINISHIKLGWAFYIQEKLRMLMVGDTTETSNEIKKFLEPIPSEDQRIEALFIALQLSAIRGEKLGENLQQKRAALLHSWFFSQNAELNNERIEFWVKEDTEAYCLFVEAFFENLYEGNVQSFVIEPLAKMWLEQAKGVEILSKFLKRWLLLVWSDELDNSANKYISKGHSFPIARNEDCLRLSSIAISILSLRPDRDLIETLALCRATLTLSYRTYNGIKRNVKGVENNIGILMRWGYTEEILPVLEVLAEKADELILEGSKYLARSLWLVNLPQLLILPQNDELENWVFVRSIDIIRKKEALFTEDTNKKRSSSFDMAELAAREDLPDLSEEDRQKIKEIVEKICQSNNLMDSRFATAERYVFDNYWPWIAKYFPEFLANLVGQLLLKALKYENPFFLISSLSGALPQNDANQSKVLVNEIIEFTKRSKDKNLKEERWPWDLEEFLFILATEEELVKWFEIIATHEELRHTIAFYPNPYIMPYLLPKGISDFAATKIMAYGDKLSNDEKDEKFTEFEFWCLLLSCITSENTEIFEWAKDIIAKNRLSDNERYMLFDLLSNTGSQTWFEDILNDSDFRENLDSTAFRAFHYSKRHLPELIKLNLSYENCMKTLPIDWVPFLFQRSERQDDFKRWGKELLRLVCNLVDESPIEPECRGRPIFELDSNGRLKWIYYRATNRQRTFGTATTSSWGVDYGNHEEFDRMIKGERSEEDNDRKALNKDLTLLKCWEHYDISRFSAYYQLKDWADKNEDDFLDLAGTYLEKVQKKPKGHWHLDILTNAILCIYLKYQPLETYDIISSLWGSPFMGTVVRRKGVPIYVDELWNLERSNKPDHQGLRIKLLQNAKNEKEIMLIVTAALANNALSNLFKMTSEEFLKSTAGKERCLGVSVLAWFGSEEAIQILEQLKYTDPSRWVRNHATWAYEVCQQEKSCRELYRKALRKDDLIQVSAILQQIKPVLIPTAKCWRNKIENEENAFIAGNPRKIALLISYWHHWGASSSSSTEVLGRKLEEYCRGEKLDTFSTQKIYPWWELPASYQPKSS